ncbi:MAG TPA: hypothetical protein VL988_05990 [Solirubrobacteraceae bacterium]|nr:hypothetical protein [Solirubrobacteraceae bacterium]
MPLIPRFAVAATVLGSVVGAIAGVLLGLDHPSTVWFALFEGAFLVGVAASLLGLLAGLIAYVLVTVWRHARRPTT